MGTLRISSPKSELSKSFKAKINNFQPKIKKQQQNLRKFDDSFERYDEYSDEIIDLEKKNILIWEEEPKDMKKEDSKVKQKEFLTDIKNYSRVKDLESQAEARLLAISKKERVLDEKLHKLNLLEPKVHISAPPISHNSKTNKNTKNLAKYDVFHAIPLILKIQRNFRLYIQINRILKASNHLILKHLVNFTISPLHKPVILRKMLVYIDKNRKYICFFAVFNKKALEYSADISSIYQENQDFKVFSQISDKILLKFSICNNFLSLEKNEDILIDFGFFRYRVRYIRENHSEIVLNNEKELANHDSTRIVQRIQWIFLENTYKKLFLYYSEKNQEFIEFRMWERPSLEKTDIILIAKQNSKKRVLQRICLKKQEIQAIGKENLESFLIKNITYMPNSNTIVYTTQSLASTLICEKQITLINPYIELIIKAFYKEKEGNLYIQANNIKRNYWKIPLNNSKSIGLICEEIMKDIVIFSDFKCFFAISENTFKKHLSTYEIKDEDKHVYKVLAEKTKYIDKKIQINSKLIHIFQKLFHVNFNENLEKKTYIQEVFAMNYEKCKEIIENFNRIEISLINTDKSFYGIDHRFLGFIYILKEISEFCHFLLVLYF